MIYETHNLGKCAKIELMEKEDRPVFKLFPFSSCLWNFIKNFWQKCYWRWRIALLKLQKPWLLPELRSNDVFRLQFGREKTFCLDNMAGGFVRSRFEKQQRN